MNLQLMSDNLKILLGEPFVIAIFTGVALFIWLNIFLFEIVKIAYRRRQGYMLTGFYTIFLHPRRFRFKENQQGELHAKHNYTSLPVDPNYKNEQR